MTHLFDLLVVAAYLIMITAVGLRAAGRPQTAAAFFGGERDLPWWAVCLSLLATETSTLTIISVPGVAYAGEWGFVGLAVGYCLGRTVVAAVLLPIYVRGGFVSAYEYLGERFGPRMRALGALTFIVTRLLAEGVRLFAASLPLAFLLEAAGLPLDPKIIIAALSAFTAIYAVAGGIRAIVWTDALQLIIYGVGALACAAILLSFVGSSGIERAVVAAKFAPFDFRASPLLSPFNPWSALIGGTIFSIASHGADQLIVQRVLACKDLKDSQKAMIGSGFLVMALFALLSFIGTLLWVRFAGAGPGALGLKGSDDLFPRFIAHGLPIGLSGLMVAGVLAAAMGSLSSALNAVSQCLTTDLPPVARLWGRAHGGLFKSRALVAGFSVIMFLCALGFSEVRGESVVVALGVAGFAYGSLLGAFCLGLIVPAADGVDAFAAFICANIALGAAIHGLSMAFTWYAPLGVAVSVVVGFCSSRLRRLKLGRGRFAPRA